jgi:hypothetical protein
MPPRLNFPRSFSLFCCLAFLFKQTFLIPFVLQQH